MDVILDLPLYKIIGDTAERMGFRAYVVGGVVRDYFLGRHCTDIDVVAEYRKRGREFEWLCCIYPTAPFVTAEKLRKAYEMVHGSGFDAIMPVVRYDFPPQRALIVRDGCLAYQFPEFENVRSQDLEPIYHDCGQFYFCWGGAFAQYGTITPPRTMPMIVSESEVQDIDNPSDWALAEMKHRVFTDRGGQSR